MIDKIVGGEQDTALAEALADVRDGSVVMVGGFGKPGQPVELVEALRETGAKNLTIVANNAGTGHRGLASVLGRGLVSKIICSYPRQRTSWAFNELYRAGRIELELVAQGTLAERIRAGGAGIAAFYTPTAYGTELAEGKNVQEFDGRHYVLERALRADVALIRAHRADRWGNLTYRGAGRNFAPLMAAAATTTIAQVEHVVPLGDIDPERVDTPGIYVDRVVHVPEPQHVDLD